MDTVLKEAIGVDGRIALLEDRIRISRKGLVALLAQKSDKEIALSDIAAVEFHRAGMTNGYINFRLSDRPRPKSSILDTAKEDNAVWFRLWQQKSFEAIKQAIQDRIGAAKV